VTPLSFLR